MHKEDMRIGEMTERVSLNADPTVDHISTAVPA